MELSQGFPVVLWLGREYAASMPLTEMDSTHTVDNVAERIQRIPVMYVHGGRTIG